MNNETLIPKIGVITDVRIDTPDIKTFRVVTPDGKKAFDHRPGQCAMLSIPGVGEAMFSITSSPTNTEYMEFSIKKCGCVTEWLHQAEVGQQITIRGPYGNPFPVDDVFAGKNMLFIAGGVGLAPLRSVINYCRHYRDRYGDIDIVYGSRSKDDLLDYKEIIEEWSNDAGVNVHLTIDNPQEGWDGHVGFVPNYVKELGFESLSPIQQEAIPAVLSGQDIIGQAQTGTGKTAAFSIPFLQLLEDNHAVQVLILTPTRELCMQVEKEVKKLSKYLRVKSVAVYGGQDINEC